MNLSYHEPSGNYSPLCLKKSSFKVDKSGDFPGSPVVKTSPSNAGSIPGREDPTCLAAKKPKKHIKQKPFCNKFNKDFKKKLSKKNKVDKSGVVVVKTGEKNLGLPLS